MLKILFRLVAAVMTLVQFVAGVGTYSPTLAIHEQEQPYPYVLVHGFGGWGFDDGLDEIATYWGGFNGDLGAFLNSTQCECYSASCGSFSGAWDRACEVYAQLTGTRVDYGAAHSAKYGHARYGKTYQKPLFEGWSQTKKVNLIAHSFGGNTVRLLATLMAQGSAEERNAGQSNLSPLFAGGHSGWIYSITTLASPHNGTTLTDVLALDNNSLVLGAAYRLFAALGACDGVTDIYDFDFGQWELTNSKGKINKENLQALLNTPDTGVYDLTLKGAKELNERIFVQDDIYYYSYAGCSTKKSPLSGRQIPASANGALTAAMMGKYTGIAINSDIVIDESWLPNDGTVNTVSALHPEGEPYRAYSAQGVQKGVWQVMPVKDYDHNAFSGGRGMGKKNATELADFIINQINIITATY